jgi:predicted TIM-barrel fold metal-dependent hydrolase
MRATVVGPLLKMLEAKRIPLILPFAEANLGVVESTARDHPELAIIVSDAPYSLMRELYPVFGACENVFMETSGFMVHRGIEDVVKKFGPGRLLFGSRYPTFVPGCAVAGLMYARISDEAKEAIAGGNAKALLSQVRLS